MDFSGEILNSFYTLYKISYLTTEKFYTDADHTIIYDRDFYLPAAIKHGDIIRENELNRITLDIMFPIESWLRRFVLSAPPYTTRIDLYVYFETNPPEVSQIFSGLINKIGFSQDNICKIELEEHDILTMRLPKILIQPSCNHILFSTGCGLTKASFKTTCTVTDIDTPTDIVSTDLTVFANDELQLGTIEFEGDKRLICGNTGTHVYLQNPFYDLEIGDTFDVYPGCDKAASTCKDKFSNLTNFLGMPYVPKKNPVVNPM